MKKYMSLCLAVLLCMAPLAVQAEETETPEVTSFTVEYEDYLSNFNLKGTVRNGTNASGNKASGGAFIHWDTGYEQEDLKGDITFTVPKSGLYHVNVIASRLNPCYVSLALDQTPTPANPKITPLDKAGEDSMYPYFSVKYFGAYSHEVTMYLTSGTHTLTTTVPRRNFIEGGKEMRDVAICLDCVTFTPAETMPLLEETTVEYEHFAGMFQPKYGTIKNQVSKPGNLASGGAYLYWDTEHLEQDLRADMSFLAEKDGFYNMTVIGHSVGGYIRIYVDDMMVLDGKNNGGTLIDEPDENGVYTYFKTSPYRAYAMESLVYIPKGRHNISTVLTRRTIQQGEQTVNDVAACIDNMVLQYTEPPKVSVAAQGESVGEFENYVDYTVMDGVIKKHGSVKEYEKGTVLNFTEIVAQDGMKLYIPLEAEEAGWYRLDVIMHGILGEWTSLVDVSVNGGTVLQNTNSYLLEDLSLAEDGVTIDYISTSYPMKKFRGMLYLPKGKSTMVYYAKKRTGQTEYDMSNGVHRVCTVADNFVFTRIYDEATLTGRNVNVKAYYEEPQNGTMISAAYKDGYLVGLAFDRMNGEQRLETEIQTTQRPDIVKIMVWDNFIEMEPSVKTKIIEIG